MLFNLKRFYGYLTVTIAVIFIWQTIAFATDTISDYQQASATNNSSSQPSPLLIMQILGLNTNHNLGPVSISGKYDSTLGAILEGRYATNYGDSWAAGIIGEYGPNNYRINTTVGKQILEDTQAKFTAEYLSQKLPFYFDAGKIEDRVGQSAYAIQLRHNFHNALVQSIQTGAYWSEAPSISLTPFTVITDNLAYTNERNLAGSISHGFDIGTSLGLSPITTLNSKLLYDDVNYQTKLVSGYDRSGVGGSLELTQILNDYTKLSLKAENRSFQTSYGSELHLLPNFIPLDISLTAQRLVMKNETPSSNIFGVNVSLTFGKSYQDPCDNRPAMTDLLSWVKEPAVHMDRVLVQSEQRTTLNGPVALSISPSSGPVTGGGTVTITGSNFLPGVVVTFGGVAATIISVTPTQIVATVPDLSLLIAENAPSYLQKLLAYISPISSALASEPRAQNIDVVVTNPNGQSMVFRSSYSITISDPVITSLSLTSGNIAGDTTITISGSHLTGTTAVTFGGTAGTSITVVNDTTLTVHTPAHAAGVVDVTITTPQGSQTSTNAYTYIDPSPTITSISPTSGSTAGSTSVTITGTHLAGTTAVTFGGSAGTSITVISDTQVTVNTPAHAAGVVDVTLATPQGSSTSTNAYTYITPTPVVTSILPNNGLTAGGSFITITGTHFTGTTAVHFGSTAAGFFVVNDTTITATVPVGSVGSVHITVTTPSGANSTSSSDVFTYFSLDEA